MPSLFVFSCPTHSKSTCWPSIHQAYVAFPTKQGNTLMPINICNHGHGGKLFVKANFVRYFLCLVFNVLSLSLCQCSCLFCSLLGLGLGSSQPKWPCATKMHTNPLWLCRAASHAIQTLQSFEVQAGRQGTYSLCNQGTHSLCNEGTYSLCNQGTPPLLQSTYSLCTTLGMTCRPTN